MSSPSSSSLIWREGWMLSFFRVKVNLGFRASSSSWICACAFSTMREEMRVSDVLQEGDRGGSGVVSSVCVVVSRWVDLGDEDGAGSAGGGGFAGNMVLM
jgi:hypothetical protein